ncbi:Coiled-coil domain-containing protein 57 [Geranomyces michiganensis]|nr:Coiled-coil domain-containing protein 57 [Geranomyces michiganensis]
MESGGSSIAETRAINNPPAPTAGCNKHPFLRPEFSASLSRVGGGVQELLSARELELRELFGALEQKLSERELQCLSLEDQLRALQDDFVYNLSLLADRDKELESYDALTDGLNTDVHDREGRIAELKTLVVERNTELANLKALLYTQEQQHHESLRKVQKDAEAELRRLEDVATARAEELELAKTDMQLQIKAARQEADVQRVAFQAELDGVKRGQEAAVRAGRQELAHQLLVAEHQASCAVAELGAVKLSRDSLEAKLVEQVEINRSLDKKLCQLEWEVLDAGKATTTRIAELERRLAKSQQSAAKAQAAFHRSREKLLLDSEEAKRVVEHGKAEAEDRIIHLTKQLASAMDQLAAERTDASQKIHVLQGVVAQKDAEIRKLHTVLDADKTDVTSLRRTHQSELAARDDVLNRQKQYISELESELDVRCNNIQTLQDQIGRQAAHEQELQRVIAQQNLDSERKVATLLRQHSGHDTDLVRSLMTAKEAAEAELKLLRGKLHAELNGRSQGYARRAPTTPPYDRKASGAHDTGNPHASFLDPYDDHIPSVVGHEENGDAAMRAENARLMSIIQQMRSDMEAMHDAMKTASAAQQPLRAWESDAHHQDGTSTAASAAQMQRLQTLLAQKQNIIDGLVAQQSALHRNLDDALRNQTGQSHDQFPLDLGYPGPSADRSYQFQRENIALRSKLVEATEDLQRMARDRSRLLDMSNSLKAELHYWTDKQETRSDVGTQTPSPLKSTVRYKALANIQPPSAIPRAVGTHQPVKQSARATKSQVEAQLRMVGRRGSGGGRGTVTSDEDVEPKGRRGRARKIRNWNERSDESD